MGQLIREVKVEQRRLSATLAELWVTVELHAPLPGAELRGRLMGPHCPGTHTVEVAYPLRPLPAPPGTPPERLTARVLIPEPNLWSPEHPFVYRGPAEVWQGGECRESVTVSTGFKFR